MKKTKVESPQGEKLENIKLVNGEKQTFIIRN